MKYVKTFEQYLQEKGLDHRDNDLDQVVISIAETLNYETDPDLIEEMLVTEFFGLGGLLKRLFINPRVKGKIKRLVDELIDVKVKQAKLSLEMDYNDYEEDNSFDEDEFDYDERPNPRSKKKTSWSSGGEEDIALQKMKDTLDDQAEAIEAKMELLAGDDDRLMKYLEMQKIEAKLKANAMIIKLADDAQQKVLKKYNKEASATLKSMAEDLTESLVYEAAGAHRGETTAFEAFKPKLSDRVEGLRKYQDLQNKAAELKDKAKELEMKGEEEKAMLARMQSQSVELKARASALDTRIKLIKNKSKK